jgi:predicted phage terminase large subunit-like protein
MEILRVSAEKLSRSLRLFSREAFGILEPSTSFVPNWHLDAMADHLEAVTSGQITNLVINIPPRHMKSLMVSVFWPVWEWVKNPSVRWLFTSYADDLSIRDAVKCRRLLQSPWYQKRWGDKCRLLSDVNQKGYYENDKGGYRLTTSINGQITGHGGDRLVLDDPHNVKEAESELVRSGVIDFIDQSWYNRYMNPKDVRRVLVMQRVHEHDATAHLLDRGDWVHLCLPAEFEAKAYSYGRPMPNPTGFVDPRKAEGELLWPDRMGPVEIANEKRSGDYYYAGQFQQRPYPRGGGMFNVAKLRERILQRRPELVTVVRSWDLAATEKPYSKRTAGVRLSKDVEGRYYIEHVVCGKWAPDKRNAIMKATSSNESDMKILFEHEGGSSGEDQALSICRLLQGRRVEAIKVTGDKTTRADPFAAQVNVGNVWIVNDGTWDVELYLHELEAFSPDCEYKDQVDASSLGFNWLSPKRGGGPTGSERVSERIKCVPLEPTVEGIGSADWRREWPINSEKDQISPGPINNF